MVVLRGNQVFVGNAGDSKCVVFVHPFPPLPRFPTPASLLYVDGVNLVSHNHSKYAVYATRLSSSPSPLHDGTHATLIPMACAGARTHGPTHARTHAPTHPRTNARTNNRFPVKAKSRMSATKQVDLNPRHGTELKLERKRILAAGGKINSDGAVFGVLYPSRGFGDIDVKVRKRLKGCTCDTATLHARVIALALGGQPNAHATRGFGWSVSTTVAFMRVATHVLPA